jgi:serine/threonine protein phosphatase PrpC
MSKIPVSGQPVILFAEECDRGATHEENQDSVLHIRIALGDLLIVADGTGGHTGGAMASRMVVEYFYLHLAALPRDYPADSAIREAVRRINAKIVAAAGAPGAPHPHMGSTVVVALLQQDAARAHAWVGNIGDSRAYLLRAGRLHRLTTDHTAVQSLLDRNMITPDEALHHPDAAVLTRILGQKPEVEIDLERHPLAIGDTLLLCSDGLWRFVPEQELETAAAGLTIESAAHDLLELALAAGGHGNISIEMARLILPPDVSPRDLSPRIESPHPGLKWILAAFLLAIAGLGVLTYLIAWWFH